MQIPLRTQSSAETYVACHEWQDARMLACPLHPSGGCSFARHGTYARVIPKGMRIARWYCPEGHQTFSLLPDFLAARLPGVLADVEAAAATVMSARSMEAAADTLRGFEVTLPSALRWLRRRVRVVQEALDAVSRLVPPLTALVSSAGLRIDPGQSPCLLGLRRSLPSQWLYRLPAPLGFRSPGPLRRDAGHQHDMGPDDEGIARYAGATELEPSSCNASPPILCQQRSFRRPRTCAASGAPIAVCKRAAPACTYSGSNGFGAIVSSASSKSGPN